MQTLYLTDFDGRFYSSVSDKKIEKWACLSDKEAGEKDGVTGGDHQFIKLIQKWYSKHMQNY